MKVEEITAILTKEFGPISSKFTLLDLTMTQATQAHSEADRPGVYVYWKNGQVIKVGRHLTNARTRALKHIRDNTEGKMAALKNDSKCHILLYTLEPSACHWAAALEILFEGKLKPAIKSGRRG
jgi:hypothetical protein